MTDARYFDDEDALDVRSDDQAVQDMARRQLAVSFVVAFALLAAAGLITARGGFAPPTQASIQHRIVKIDAPRMEIAQPTLKTTPRG